MTGRKSPVLAVKLPAALRRQQRRLAKTFARAQALVEPRLAALNKAWRLPPETTARLESLARSWATLQAELAPVFERLDKARDTPDFKGWNRLHQILTESSADPLIAASPAASDFVRLMAYLVADGVLARSADEVLRPLDGLMPLGELGAKFKTGRKPGAVSPLRQAVRRMLQRDRDATARDIWLRLAARPPKRLAFFQSTRLGWYVETDGKPDTSYRRFQNIVSQERRAMRQG